MLVRELAEALGLTFEGDGDAPLTGANDIRSAGPSELSFAANRKALAGAGAAGCLVLPPGFDAPPGVRAVLRAADSRTAFARAIALLHPPRAAAGGVHPTAVVAHSAEVDPTASIGPHATVGERVRIGAGTVIGAGSRIGDDCVLGAHCTVHAGATLYDRVRVGDRVVLHSGCVLGADGFGFAFANGRYEKFPQIGTVEIGNDVEIGANSCIDRAALGVTSIGEGTKLDNMVHIGHNCRIGRHVVIAAQTGLSGGVVVEDYVVVGGQVGIGDKAVIRSGVTLGSGSGVLTSKVVRPGTYWGTPARPLKEYLRTLAEVNRLGRTRSAAVAEHE